MNGLAITYSGALSPPITDPEWRLSALANFDQADGPDLVFQNTITNQLFLWRMMGPMLLDGDFLNPSVVTPTWQIEGSR